MIDHLVASLLLVAAVTSPSGAPALGTEAPLPVTIGVSPPRFEIEIGAQAVDEAIRVFNFGKEPAEIRVSVYNWNLDDENRLQLLEPNEQSLDQWIVVNPLRFAVPAGKFQTVRFSVRPRVRPEPGEHRAILLLEQSPRQVEARDSLQIVGQVGVAVYGYAGEIRREGRLHGIAFDARGSMVTAAFDIASLGSAHVRLSGRYGIWQAARYPGPQRTTALPEPAGKASPTPEGMLESGFLPSLPVLPDSRRRIPLRLTGALPPGSYILDVNGELGGVPIDRGFPFVVEASNVPQGAPE